jgi:hypothetical protein
MSLQEALLGGLAGHVHGGGPVVAVHVERLVQGLDALARGLDLGQ